MDFSCVQEEGSAPLNSAVALFSCGRMALIAACAIEIRSFSGRVLLNFCRQV